MTWLIDFKGYSMRTAPPIRMQIQTTQMLQNHYPERLGLAVCYHAPRLFSFAYRVRSRGSAALSLELWPSPQLCLCRPAVVPLMEVVLPCMWPLHRKRWCLDRTLPCRSGH